MVLDWSWISKYRKKIKFYLYKRNFENYRLGAFWCDKHWDVIRKSLADVHPINPSVAAIGITTALYLKNIDPEVIRKNGAACCWVKNLDTDNQKILEGIFQRARKWN